MSSPFGKLERILKLEQEQGFHDRAVIGGLERFLVFWLKEAQAKGAETPAGLTVVQVASALSNYARRSEQERRERVEKLLNRIAGTPEEPVPAAKATEPRAAVVSTATSEPEERAVEPVETQSAPVETLPVESPAEATLAPIMEPEPEESPAEPMPFRSTGLKPTASVVALKGVSTVTQEKLARLGIATVDDLIHHFPRRHDDLRHLKPIGQLEPGLPATVVGAVHSVSSQRARGGRQIVRLLVSDGTGLIEATWFGQPYLARSFKQGLEIVLSGTVSEYLGRLVLTSPEWEPLQRDLLHTGRLVPAYSLTEGISARRMRSLIRSTVADVAPQIVDPLPDDILQERGLMGLAQALEQAHFPDNEERLEQAQRRLAFDEFLLLQLGLLRQRRAWRRQKSRALFIPRERIDAFIQGLPFQLTGAQTREIEAILEDLSQAVPMSRLLQGDVGSGKTVVAAAAILAVAHNGLQVAVMAPTTILAEQHHRTLTSLLGADESMCCELLVGRLPEEEKARIRSGLQEGHIRIVVGTHALIQDTVRFAKLGLVIVDEQHRFGVAQRQALLDKGRPEGGESLANDGAEPVADDAAGLCPHLLAMSATPIPRSLALAVYGDMDVSIIDEMPPSRKEESRPLRDGASRERIYAFIRTQIEAGRQAYVICAAIDEQEPFEVRGGDPGAPALAKDLPTPNGGVVARQDGERRQG